MAAQSPRSSPAASAELASPGQHGPIAQGSSEDGGSCCSGSPQADYAPTLLDPDDMCAEVDLKQSLQGPPQGAGGRACESDDGSDERAYEFCAVHQRRRFLECLERSPAGTWVCKADAVCRHKRVKESSSQRLYCSDCAIALQSKCHAEKHMAGRQHAARLAVLREWHRLRGLTFTPAPLRPADIPARPSDRAAPGNGSRRCQLPLVPQDRDTGSNESNPGSSSPPPAYPVSPAAGPHALPTAMEATPAPGRAAPSPAVVAVPLPVAGASPLRALPLATPAPTLVPTATIATAVRQVPPAPPQQALCGFNPRAATVVGQQHPMPVQQALPVAVRRSVVMGAPSAHPVSVVPWFVAGV
eukprot:TRINITY_DN61195_c0_g1_i1.p1 TRINITY_DN61195_c0_g1~~TRINITY_DN61195_c0_g1_i1.p1  ORF type:complete len:357 (+),score=62.29 TRINITY_DN61195_c0_g1_i1:111-1181(+)